MNVLIAPCGIDCATCSVYIATQNNDTAARIKLAEQFKANHDKDIDPETIVCDGCSSADRHLGFCSVCQIRTCAFDRGFQTCAECLDLPCAKGQFIWQKNSLSLKTLEELKKQS